MKRGLTLVICVVAVLAIYAGFRAFAPAGEGFSEDPTVGGGEGGQSVSPGVLGDSAARPSTSGTQAAAAPLVLALEGEGLRLFDAATGSARPLPFGTRGETVRSILATGLELAAIEEGYNSECTGNFMRLENGLTAWFVNDAFAGWAVRGPAPTLTTASGIGIGSSRGDLESVYDASIFRSTLGIEFTAGGLAGLLESELPEARITHLWAGQTCIAR